MQDLSQIAFPVLETERLQLVELTPRHAESLHRIRRDEHIMQYIARRRTSSREDAVDLIDTLTTNRASGIGLSWGIVGKEGAGTDLMGIIGLYRIVTESSRGELGYTLHSDHWGQGLMSEAIRSVIAYAFDALDFHSLEAHTDARNDRSIQTLKRNGFRSVGTWRENIYFDGQWIDSALWELLAADYSAK